MMRSNAAGQYGIDFFLGILSLAVTTEIKPARATNRFDPDHNWFTHVQHFIQRLFCNASVSILSRLRKYNKRDHDPVNDTVQSI
jgi:hypothetical protein